MEAFSLLLLCFSLLNLIPFCAPRDTINTLQSISDGETLVSADETFALGFFSPGTSKNRYVGIWYNKDPKKAIVWVANRETPLTDSSGVLKVNTTGILVLLDSNNSLIWSSNTTGSARSPVAKLLNSGNFVVQDDSNSDTEDFVWQSFAYPGDTILPGQKLGRNLATGLNRRATSWKSSDDPSPGSFSYQVEIDGYPQLVLRDGTTKRFRFGSWNGIQFSGGPQLKNDSVFRFSIISDEEETYSVFWLVDSSVHQRVQITSDGFCQRASWSAGNTGWTRISHLPVDYCDYYGNCGAYASCDTTRFPMCNCLDGFVQNTTDSSSGCVRRTSLSCNHSDGFVKFSGLKLPDTEGTRFNRSMRLEDCRILCWNDCSCMAYAALDVSKGPNGCLLWFGNLIDMKVMNASVEDIYIKMAGKEVEAIEQNRSTKSKKRKQKIIIAVSCVLSFGILILCLAFIIYGWKKYHKGKIKEETESGAINSHHDEDDLELPLFDMCTITSATSNFSSDNILGTGGFGSVYKGILENGREIAVKRLSQNSSQGLQEFKNEVMHIAKLQHRNLVKLLGYCIQAGERILIYEFMRNKSLDFFIFDCEKGKLLDWPKRFLIINGIVRGLLYLHQDSRHRIVHRDLKAGNILLDDELNPRISDFGLARSFVGNENQANTRHIVGTYGYLSPEYIVDGIYSTKSDVYSFGVLVLEIVSGKRNRGFIHIDHNFNLLGHAWTLFSEGKCLQIVDPSIKDSIDLPEVLRSIHVGLLCVQLNSEDRPSMSCVLTMLSSEWALPQPKKPGFFIERDVVGNRSSSSNNKLLSVNNLTATQVCPR
ncbi:G-type lectin S-receptor-like serine/threonine-protein kinase At4g27290 [Arachis hypogaea]|nr:G-type lectin S-receptor-like serine/threonine-protein kinase At4g27290 [Arachis hypogaea]